MIIYYFFRMKLELHFTLIAASLSYVLWKSVGRKVNVPKIYNGDMEKIKGKSTEISCEGTSKGVFFGLMALTSGLVAIITTQITSKV